MFKNILVTVIAALLLSCGGQKSPSKNDVTLFMNEYFEKVKQNDFTLIESYYSETFYENTNREKWKELYTKIHSTLGTLVSVELESWSVRSVLATSGSGKYFTLVYKNKYENGTATETITIFIPKGDDKIKINGHNYKTDISTDINSDISANKSINI